MLEQGPAAFAGVEWVYAATQAHPAGISVSITATAVDRLGNRGSKMTIWS